jgi:hypothetical protein
MAFIIKTPNEKYNGITEGVPFVNGQAKVEDEVVRNVLVNNYGYIDATEKVEKPKQAEEKAPKQRKASGK